MTVIVTINLIIIIAIFTYYKWKKYNQGYTEVSVDNNDDENNLFIVTNLKNQQASESD